MKADWIDYKEKYIYHYTSKYFAKCILESKTIHLTPARVRCFGFGVFMTLMNPTMFDDRALLENNYQGNNKYSNRIECAFAVDRSMIKAEKFIDPRAPNRDLWRNGTQIDLTKVDFFLINRTNSDFI